MIFLCMNLLRPFNSQVVSECSPLTKMNRCATLSVIHKRFIYGHKKRKSAMQYTRVPKACELSGLSSKECLHH